MKVAAGIITYNPDIQRLKENIDNIAPQVNCVIVVDNASDNYGEVKCLIENCRACFVKCNFFIISNNKNKGVAYALNQIMSRVEKVGDITWCLTLDQDTVVYDNIMEMYSDFIDANVESDSSIVSISCLRQDRNYQEKDMERLAKNHDKTPYEYVESCITSGNLVKLSAWRDIKGFDNRLFIDMVDDEFCFRLRENGYKIVRINKVGYLHELGNNLITVNFFGKKKTIFGYSNMRKYYTARNTTYMVRRYKLKSRNPYSIYLKKRVLGTLLYEKNKLKAMRFYVKGIRDGKKMEFI